MDEQNEINVNLQELFRLFLKNILLIIICAVVFAAAFSGVSRYIITPKYTCTSKLYVVTSSDKVLNFSDLQISSSLTADYIQLITGRPFILEVIEKLGLDKEKYSYPAIKGMITVNNPADTRLLNINVTGVDTDLNLKIANTLADISVDRLYEIIETSTPKVVEYASTNSMVSPNSAKNTTIGFVLGALICYAIILIRFYSDDTIKTYEDVEKYVGLNVVGYINDSPQQNKRADKGWEGKKA